MEDDLHGLKEFEHKSRRLVVGYSAKRAGKDAADRQRLVDRLMKKVKGDKIRVKDLIPHYGSKKYISIENGSASINQEKIKADAQWDGFHGVITNATGKTSSELLSRYRELWQIEEAFRISKHDLKMRPIFHWTENRIKAHIAICFLAFTLAKQAVYRIALQQEPMSFEQIRNELLHAQSSVVIDLASQKKYMIPSHVTVNQKKLYQAFGLKRSQVPQDFLTDGYRSVLESKPSKSEGFSSALWIKRFRCFDCSSVHTCRPAGYCKGIRSAPEVVWWRLLNKIEKGRWLSCVVRQNQQYGYRCLRKSSSQKAKVIKPALFHLKDFLFGKTSAQFEPLLM